MVEWLGLGFVTLGACTMVVAAVLANIVFFRYPLTRRLSTHDSLARRGADLALATSLLRCAALSLGGATVLVFGLVVGRGSAAWTFMIPLSPLVLVAIALAYVRRSRQRRNQGFN